MNQFLLYQPAVGLEAGTLIKMLPFLIVGTDTLAAAAGDIEDDVRNVLVV
jgi:hypothetical protein